MTATRPPFLELLAERVICFDGAMGSALETAGAAAGVEADRCNELLSRTHPDLVRGIHDRYLTAGCHVVSTNSFGGSRPVLAEHGLGDETHELNRLAAALAREVAQAHSRPDRPRYVAGSLGPGSKLPSLGQIGFDELVTAYREQAAGLLDGGVDLLLVETCQDPLQVRAALLALRRELRQRGQRLPLAVTLTLERQGTMLLGTELAAALAAILPLRPDLLGLNCATGPLEMKGHVATLSRHCPLPLLVQPNAGLPENVGGRAVYALSPEELARWHVSFITEDGVQAVGGCCGTTPEHLAAVVRQVEGLTPARRDVTHEPALASLYTAQPLAQEPRPFLVGERTNATGSRRFRDLLLESRYDDLVAVAREQERGGAHALDLSCAYAGRDEALDLPEAVARFRLRVRLPLIIDSTRPEVMEAALKLHGGRCALNSINLEEGEERARAICSLAADHGAAVIALTIDERGMARTVEHKLAVAERLYTLAVTEHGLAPQDLIFDPLTFTVGSGEASLRDAARQTLEGIAALKQRFPACSTLLGVSNVSYGLKPRARRALNAVFLGLAVARGLDLAIIDAGKLLPLSRVDPRTRELAEDLLLDRRIAGQPDPLLAFIEHLTGGDAGRPAPDPTAPAASLPRRIQRAVLDGDPDGLDRLLAAALTRYQPLAIIEELLVPAMKEVGDLFGAGQMQLPFVLQSAEVMRGAVAYLEPALPPRAAAGQGTLVLATVRGDVHDIGKNLVAILLAQSGFRVVDLGIKVPVEEMIRALEAEEAPVLGMSGLLVKSTQVMKENLLALRRRGLHPPVLLGGAALTRRFVEEELREIYGDRVHYARDVFDGLTLMRRLVASAPTPAPAAPSDPALSTTATPVREPRAAVATEPAATPTPLAPAPVPRAPFLGTREVDLPLDEVLALLDEGALFRGRWGYRRGTLSEEAYARLLAEEVRPTLARLQERCLAEAILRPRAVYGYFPAVAQGDALLVLDGASGAERSRLRFPRQRRTPHRSIVDYFRPHGGEPDLLGCFVVTVGEEAARCVTALYAEHRYADYLHLHGLAAQSAEAAAELLHRRMRQELGIAGEDAPDPADLCRGNYRGARFSFGYAACPDLEEQRPLFALLQPERVGVTLSESAQMVPEQSVSAVVVHHPAARHFAV